MTQLMAYWSQPELLSNMLILLNIIGATLLGMVIGYERSFHGHAAGMRTYGLVCMASAALVVVGGYPALWYGGANAGHETLLADPTRIIQGVVTGVGFIGAGVIMKEGFTIRGLSTAASIWSTAVIGMISGIGFYATAIIATLLVLVVMGSFKRLELRLPHRRQARISLVYRADRIKPAVELAEFMRGFGFEILDMSCHSDDLQKQLAYDLVLQGDGSHNFSQLIDILRKIDCLMAFRLEPVHD